MRTLADKYIARAISLLRAGEGEAIRMSSALRDVYDQIEKDLQEEYPKLNRLSLELLDRKIKNKLKKFYDEEFPSELLAISTTVIQKELKWVVKTLFDETAKEIAQPKYETIVKRVSRKSYQGHTFEFWSKKQSIKNSERISFLLKDSFVQSRPLAEVVSDVHLLSNRSRADVRTLVRSYTAHAATEAKDTIYGINPDIVEGAIWVSTLDHRTTPYICGVRDTMLYDSERNPVGHTLPWSDGPGRIHWNCRSISVPKLVGIPYNGMRSATGAGANYVRGDATTRTGRVRKYGKDAREKGIFKIEDKRATTAYENWLREESRHNIDFVSDILNSKENAQRFRDGDVSLFQLGLESPIARPTNINSL